MTQPATMPAQLGRYRVLKPLGQGGMGSVYLAEDPVLRRRVAVKVPLLGQAGGTDARQRFYREARAAAAIKHPNVCPILDVGEDDAVPFLVMEFIEGTPLSEHPEAGHPWPVGRAAALVRKLALAVGQLHACGLVHRDLKPGNVVLRSDGEPVLLDFGLARSFTAQSRQLTAPGLIVGTPMFMAPEQVRGDSKAIGPATDIYALGVILYELLTGTLPFVGSPAEVFGQILEAQPESPSARRPGLDPGLDAVCLRALAKEPGQRFATMAELAGALAPFAETGTPEAAEVVVFGETVAEGETAPVPGGGRRRWQAWAWAVGVLVLSAVVGIAVVLWPNERTDPVRPGPGEPADFGKRTDLPEEITNSAGMKLVLVKPGRFQMGCAKGENGYGGETPQHWVTITKPFYLGVYEVTQREYEAVMGEGTNPSEFKKGRVGRDTSRFPVDSVTCDEAEYFCQLLSESDRDKGLHYRLPTEAEWEYACRGGHKYKESAPFYFRKPAFSLDATQANFKGAEPYGGAEVKPSRDGPAPVGSYQPNALGLFDMHGNVWEWCADDKRTYREEDIKDPVGSQTSERRVLRGGAGFEPGRNCRAACRGEQPRTQRGNCLGFRVCASARTP